MRKERKQGWMRIFNAKENAQGFCPYRLADILKKGRARFFIGAAQALFLLTGCSLDVSSLPGGGGLPLVGDIEALTSRPYHIYPGDDLDIKIYEMPLLSDSAKVRPDGMITMQLVGDVKAAGRTPTELSSDLERSYKPYVKDPRISVIVRSFSGHRAYVGGEVAIPQTVPLEGGVSVMQAIYRSGGNRITADMEQVVLIRQGADYSPIAYVLDLSGEALVSNKKDSQVALLDSDIVFIPRTGIAQAGLNMQQYVRDLLLFNGSSLGASYIYMQTNNPSNWRGY